jgi:hypothetical protein
MKLNYNGVLGYNVVIGHILVKRRFNNNRPSGKFVLITEAESAMTLPFF